MFCEFSPLFCEATFFLDHVIFAGTEIFNARSGSLAPAKPHQIQRMMGFKSIFGFQITSTVNFIAGFTTGPATLTVLKKSEAKSL